MNGMNFAQVAFKMSHVAMLTAALSLVGCGGGGGGGVIGANQVGGLAQKGPFQKGSTVTICQLAAPTYAACGPNSVSTTVTNNLGSYTSPNVSWSGLTEVSITGQYLNEVTAAVVGPDTVKAVINLPAVGATVTQATANPNVVTTIAAQVAKTNLAAAVNSGVPPDSILNTSTASVVNALGLPAGTDPTKLDVTKDPQLLVLSATLLDATAAAAPGTTIQTLAASLATDIQSGSALGTTAAVNNTITTSLTTYAANANTIVNNLSTAVTAAGGATTVTAATVQTASNTTQANSQATLKGFVLSGNNVNFNNAVPPINATVNATTGAVTVGSVPATALQLTMTLLDNNGGANTPGVATGANPIRATIEVAVRSVALPTKQILLSFPVDVALTGLTTAGVTITQPAGASVTYTGMTGAGTTILPTTVPLPANVIPPSGNNTVTVDLYVLLIGITYAPNTTLATLIKPGDYDVQVGFSGIKLGGDNAGGLAANLYPIGTYVAGNAITGRITIQ